MRSLLTLNRRPAACKTSADTLLRTTRPIQTQSINTSPSTNSIFQNAFVEMPPLKLSPHTSGTRPFLDPNRMVRRSPASHLTRFDKRSTPRSTLRSSFHRGFLSSHLITNRVDTDLCIIRMSLVSVRSWFLEQMETSCLHRQGVLASCIID